MAEVGRCGVFLPSYIWEGDGPERARGIKSFARRVEDLGFVVVDCGVRGCRGQLLAPGRARFARRR